MNETERTKIVRDAAIDLRALVRRESCVHWRATSIAELLESTLPPEDEIDLGEELAARKQAHEKEAQGIAEMLRRYDASTEASLNAKRANLEGDFVFDGPDGKLDETLVEKLTQTVEDRWLYERERALQELADLICETREKRGVSRMEIADYIQVSPEDFDGLLDGEKFLTPLSVAMATHIFAALDCSLHFTVSPLGEEAESPHAKPLRESL